MDEFITMWILHLDDRDLKTALSEVKVKSLSRVRLLATPWTAAYQAPTSMGFSRQEYWSGVPSLVKALSLFIAGTVSLCPYIE